MEFTIEGYSQTFRVKKMNAIEALAFRTTFDIDDFNSTVDALYRILEYVEVKVVDKWLPVKEKNEMSFMPTGIEDNVNAINQISKFFINDYLKPLFRKSDESKT